MDDDKKAFRWVELRGKSLEIVESFLQRRAALQEKHLQEMADLMADKAERLREIRTVEGLDDMDPEKAFVNYDMAASLGFALLAYEPQAATDPPHKFKIN